jgi:hypothetical protein
MAFAEIFEFSLNKQSAQKHGDEQAECIKKPTSLREVGLN